MTETSTTKNKSVTAPASINADLADTIGAYLILCAQRRLWQTVGRTAGLTGHLINLEGEPVYSALHDALSRYIAALSRHWEYDAWPAIAEYMEYVAECDKIIVSDVVGQAIQIARDLRMGSRGRS